MRLRINPDRDESAGTHEIAIMCTFEHYASDLRVHSICRG